MLEPQAGAAFYPRIERCLVLLVQLDLDRQVIACLEMFCGLKSVQIQTLVGSGASDVPVIRLFFVFFQLFEFVEANQTNVGGIQSQRSLNHEGQNRVRLHKRSLAWRKRAHRVQTSVLDIFAHPTQHLFQLRHRCPIFAFLFRWLLFDNFLPDRRVQNLELGLEFVVWLLRCASPDETRYR